MYGLGIVECTLRILLRLKMAANEIHNVVSNLYNLPGNYLQKLDTEQRKKRCY